MIIHPNPQGLLGGSWDLVSKVISTVIGAISTYKSIVTMFITLVTKSHDPLSTSNPPCSVRRPCERKPTPTSHYQQLVLAPVYAFDFALARA